MSTTVLVALITSISTLSGAVVTGIISQSIQKRQFARQAELASSERSEQRRQARVESQKQVYIQFLNSFDDAERLVRKCWEEKGCGDGKSYISDAQRAAWDALNDLERVLNLIAIEGPIEMMVKAVKLHDVLRTELMHVVHLSSDKDYDGLLLMSGESSGWRERLATRRAARMSFIGTGQKVLYESPASDIPDTAGPVASLATNQE